MRLEAKIELFEIVPQSIIFTPCELFSERDWDPKRSELAIGFLTCVPGVYISRQVWKSSVTSPFMRAFS